jgi:chaperonin GroEL
MDQIETAVYGVTDKQITNAVIYTGGSTEAVGLEVYDKVIDALNSVQTAKREGVVAGGGVTYWRMAEMLEQYEGENAIGVKILAQALKEPRKALVRNLPDYYMALRGTGWEGYNFKTGKIEDMFEAGIIDSAAVGQSVLIDSISLARLLLDIEVSIVRKTKNVESNAEVDEIQSSYKL